jgi:hypothetical protein
MFAPPTEGAAYSPRILAPAKAGLVTSDAGVQTQPVPAEHLPTPTPTAPLYAAPPPAPAATPWYKNWKIMVPVGVGGVAVIGLAVWALKKG